MQVIVQNVKEYSDDANKNCKSQDFLNNLVCILANICYI